MSRPGGNALARKLPVAPVLCIAPGRVRAHRASHTLPAGQLCQYSIDLGLYSEAPQDGPDGRHRRAEKQGKLQHYAVLLY